jgi:long-chain acyl-CoA synthetase
MASFDLGSQARAQPDHPAIIMGADGRVVTYAELNDGSNRFAQLLRASGVVVGDAVAVLMENNARYLEVTWGAHRCGCYYTAINSHLQRDEIQYIVEDCGAKVLVTSVAMADRVSQLDLSGVELCLVVGGALEGFDSYEERCAACPAQALPDEVEGREMLYSSGTTGRPKGVRKELEPRPLGDLSTRAVELAKTLELFGFGPDAVYLSPAPLYHTAPLVYCMSMLRVGVTVVIMEHFDPVRCLELIEQQRITHAQFVPTMFVRMLKLNDEQRLGHDLSSLKFVVHAAAPCPVPVKRQMLEWWGPIIHEYYAGTEDIGATWITASEWLTHPGSVGRPLSPVHIVGEDGQELAVGQEGAVYFEGGRPFRYHNDPEKTARVSNDRGWRTLGDVGRLDEEGYLYLTDRQAYMIIAGGVNIYPQETEDVLTTHPDVADVAVIGVPDPDMGEAVKAVVELRPGVLGDADLEARLIAYCRESLAAFKCPRSVDFIDELPRDPNGKLYKRRVKDRYWEGHDSRIV